MIVDSLENREDGRRREGGRGKGGLGHALHAQHGSIPRCAIVSSMRFHEREREAGTPTASFCFLLSLIPWRLDTHLQSARESNYNPIPWFVLLIRFFLMSRPWFPPVNSLWMHMKKKHSIYFWIKVCALSSLSEIPRRLGPLMVKKPSKKNKANSILCLSMGTSYFVRVDDPVNDFLVAFLPIKWPQHKIE